MEDKEHQKFSFLDLITKLVDIVLPPRCIGSGEIVDIQGAISPKFWEELQFIDKPFCDKCSIPFSFDSGEGAICARCMDDMPYYDRSRSAVVYNDASRKVILNFKFNDKTHYALTFVPWMLRAGADILEDADYIIPVPLHQKKLRFRKFNQSAILAEEIAIRSNKKYLFDGLLRIRETTPQKGLNKKDRLKNISGAFAINQKYTEAIQGKNIIIVDDIFTTGATLNECAKVLKDAGANEVNVLAIARVTTEEFSQ